MNNVIRDDRHPTLRFETLESRRLLAQTPQLLFDVIYDNTLSEGANSLSSVYQIKNALVARSSGPIDLSGQLEVFDTTTGKATELAGFPTQRVTRFAEFNDELFLFFDTNFLFGGSGGVGQEVWKSDGQTVELVKAISNIGSQENGDSDQFTFVLNDRLYFLADNEVRIDEESRFISGEYGLWSTDGTEEGTAPALQLLPEVRRIYSATELDGRVLLSMENSNGHEFWTFDGTESGSQRLLPSAPSNLAMVNDRLIFAADSDLGLELYITDGTPEGTELLADLLPGVTGSNPRAFIEHGNRLFFTADAGDGDQLWTTDGSVEGTMTVFDELAIDAKSVGDLLYFTTETSLYQFDSTSAQTTMLHSADSGIELLAVTDHVLMFRAGDETYSVNTDGVMEFAAPPGEVVLSTGDTIIFANTTLTAVENPTGPSESIFTLELWATDGTEEGTSELSEPIIDRGGSELIGTDTSLLLEAQQFGDQMVLRFLTQRWLGDRMRIAAYSIDLPDPALDGDANRDGEINFADFLVLSSNFGKMDAIWADGDFDGNGVVDFADFLLLSENFGTRLNAS